MITDLIWIFLIIIFMILSLSKNYNSEGFVPTSILTNFKHLEKNKILLKKFHDFCVVNNLEYWVVGGTMLGSIRDKGIIPWDDDLDVAMVERDALILKNMEIELKKINLGIAGWFGGYKIYDLDGESMGNLNYTYPFIDIFIMIKNTEGKYVYKSIKARKLWPEVYDVDDIYPIKLYEFEDYHVYGMSQATKFLNKYFSNWKNIGMKYYDHINQKPIDKIVFQIDYDTSNKPYLWTYWDGNEYDYIKLCYDTVLKNCSKSFQVVRLNNENIRKYIPELIEYEKYIEKLIIPHKVDIYRIMLLYKYGGLYIDADTMVMRDPIEIMNKLKKYEYVGFGCTGNKCKYGYKLPSNGIMASKPNSILMGRIMEKLIDKIKDIYFNNEYGNIRYFDLGKVIIWKELDELIKNSGYEYYHYPNRYDGTRDIEGNWVTSEIMFSDKKILYEKEDEMIFVTLYNSTITENIKKMSKDELLSKSTNFKKYISIALGI